MLNLSFDNTYARELPGFYVAWKPAPAPAPRLVYFNDALAAELGLPADLPATAGLADMFVGNRLPAGAEPLAQAYAGHQFGGFSPKLGDGRALLVGEVIDRHGRRRDIAFKGSGRTPFSRGGDGKAAVGPMLREVIIGEAMHALGIPTTRALAVAATGEPVMREMPLPGAVLTRVAASHLRVGTFQYFVARGEIDKLKQLADYAIARHDPALIGTPDRAFGLLRAVAERQAKLIAQWMNVGFIHGVMNTDNMTISGETIDFGPCAFMETMDPATVFSSIDHGGRYAYGNQPHVARWNLAKLAEALLPLVADGDDKASVDKAVAEATAVIEAFPEQYVGALLAGQRAKLGLQHAGPADDEGDAALAVDWLSLLQRGRVDFTLGWRRLADAATGNDRALRALFTEEEAPGDWLARWRERCAADDAANAAAASDPVRLGEARARRMRQVNPFVIPRNHRVEEALTAASDNDDFGPFESLLAAVRRPFEETPDLATYGEPAPPSLTAGYQTFCGT